MRSYDTAGRARPEPDECSLRTPFQRDRDRIVHSKSFRRLKGKTQVFIAPQGDHFRTRMTHTLEVAGISRGVARALRLNEDLAEAIALGHDLGHPPFGHTGEEALDRCLKRLGSGFRHNEHSLRMVDVLERGGFGLNLTAEVRDGILNHTGPGTPASLEGRIVRLVDRFGYVNHDIDDAARAGILDPADLPGEPVALLGRTSSDRIDALVHDLVETSAVAGDIAPDRRRTRRRSWPCAPSCSSTSTWARGPGRERPRRRRWSRRSSPTTWPSATPQSATDWVAGHDRRLRAAGARRARRGGALAGVSRISEQSLENVKAAVDMVDLVGGRTTLRRSGARYTGRCPFHDERTPRSRSTRSRSCTTASAARRAATRSGSSRTPRTSTSSPPSSGSADRYGVELDYEESSPEARAASREQRDGCWRCSRTRPAFYYPLPVGVRPRPSPRARYLAERGLTEETAATFRLGYSPRRAWDRRVRRRPRQGLHGRRARARRPLEPRPARPGRPLPRPADVPAGRRPRRACAASAPVRCPAASRPST